MLSQPCGDNVRDHEFPATGVIDASVAVLQTPSEFLLDSRKQSCQCVPIVQTDVR